MKPIKRLITVILLAALGAVTLSTVAYGAGLLAGTVLSDRPPETRTLEGFSLFWEAWSLVERDFVGELPPREEYDRGAARGLLLELGDKPTGLLSPQYATMEREDSTGYYRGIGASVTSSEDGYIEVSTVFRGSPAEEAGILPGDVIVAVDGVDIQGLGLSEAVALIRGPEGTTVELELRHAGASETEVRQVERRSLEIPNVSLEMLPDGIAYLVLSEFNSRATAQLQQALKEVAAASARGLVLDLRGNPGGFLDQAVSIADEFLNEGTVVIERGRQVAERSYRSKDGGLATEVPLVVLVNESSASAAEIVAGAVQDRGRGALVGARTYGKGSVQYLFDLTDGSQIRVTTALWYTPNDSQIQGEGLQPDVEVADDPGTEEDEQLAAALRYLQEGAN